MNAIARILIIISAIAALSLDAAAQRTTRRVKATDVSAAALPPVSAPYDTLQQPAADGVVAAGFEKTLSSRRESLLLTNKLERHITDISFTITYLDTQGRMLHRADHTVTIDIPPGQTRAITFASWDTQGVTYYIHSPRPTRARQATPFDVAITINYVTTPKNPSDTQQ